VALVEPGPRLSSPPISPHTHWQAWPCRRRESRVLCEGQAVLLPGRHHAHPGPTRYAHTYTSKPGGRYRTRSHQSTSARSNHRAASAFAAGLSCVIAISLLQHNRLKQPHSHAAGGSQRMARAADCSPATGSGAAGRSGSSVFPRRDQSYCVKWRLPALSRRTCRPRDSGLWRRRSLARSRSGWSRAAGEDGWR
jgi:hypothetical protein